MRTIRFRAKVQWNGGHYESSQWIIGHYAYFNEQHQIYDCEENYTVGLGDFTRYEWVEIDETTLGQYTGLKDKNGVEIYECDIVDCHGYRLIYSTAPVEDASPKKGKVEYLPGGFVVDRLALAAFSDIEVVGNIYDTPELIEDAS